MDTNTIYCFWTGNNPMSEQRKKCLQDSIEISKCKIVLVTLQNLHEYILNEHPVHPAYHYLSETHKSDYLRTYFANFHGGGYMDVKRTLGPWDCCFEELRNSDKWIYGYAMDGDGHIAYAPNKPHWRDLIGTGAYICKPHTELTKQWYQGMNEVLDAKLEKLKLNPSKYTNDSTWTDSGYPMGWTEILGEVFHRVLYDHKDKIINTLPKLDLNVYDYR